LVLDGSEVGKGTVQRFGGRATEDPEAIAGDEHRAGNGAIDPVYATARCDRDRTGDGGAGQHAENHIGSCKCGATKCEVRDRASGLEIRKQHDRAAEQLEAGDLIMQLQSAARESGYARSTDGRQASRRLSEGSAHEFNARASRSGELTRERSAAEDLQHAALG